ncbi:MAG TPA: ATP-binding protein, partial [Thermomicrobiales bacterium]|nr:ATP-binding protein [Thermomicrobiales bacterium]
AAPDHPVMVDGDEHRLQQVVLNLLSNAITHAPETERIDVRLLAEEDVAVIEVEDAGPGIAEEDLPRVFTRFFQTGSTRTARGGLGLGLYITREIVTAHGGTIAASSTVGEGSTFTVRLPVLAETARRRDGQDE